jgi:hypothetical protein
MIELDISPAIYFKRAKVQIKGKIIKYNFLLYSTP